MDKEALLWTIYISLITVIFALSYFFPIEQQMPDDQKTFVVSESYMQGDTKIMIISSTEADDHYLYVGDRKYGGGLMRLSPVVVFSKDISD